MIGFCGALDFEKRAVRFSVLKKMCGLHSSGCAFVNREFGILCDGSIRIPDCDIQPVTVSYNNSLYTAAVIAPAIVREDGSNMARSVLEGYFEEGEEFLHRLDFPYALALYDARCGELMLAKGHTGDKGLFYTVKDGTLYFASALRPLFRLYGGCVRVSKKALARHVTGGYSSIPTDLFCDIRILKPAHSLICSCFGQSCVPTACSSYIGTGRTTQERISPIQAKKADVRYILNQALFAFDYPQFDCYMPYLLPSLEEYQKKGEHTVYISDAISCDCKEYSAERADRLGKVWGLDVYFLSDDKDTPSSRELKKMEKELDDILSEYLSSSSCIIREFDRDGVIDIVKSEKSTPLRIRKKGLLCQCAMWFDSFNLVLDE